VEHFIGLMPSISQQCQSNFAVPILNNINAYVYADNN